MIALDKKMLEKREMQVAAAAGIVIILFLVFYFAGYGVLNYFTTGDWTGAYNVDGLKIYSAEQPRAALAKILSGKSFLIEEQLFPNKGDERTIAVGIVGAELAYALAAHNKSANAYGTVDGVPSVNCNANTSNCTGSNIMVGISDCNCMRISGDKVEISGGAKFLRDNAVKFYGIFQLVLNDIAPTPLPAPTIPVVSPEAATPEPTAPACTVDSNCSTGGPYGIICGPADQVGNLSTEGEWKPEYKCFEKEANATSCKCMAGKCRWERTPAFCECGKSYNKTFTGC
ncbi:MAG: hypothetical protein NTY90_02205 [Candidatus Micrarchaeota archaeon]|nr:hypothetical protein [Candidatus Micrarchaeota archaeon]